MRYAIPLTLALALFGCVQPPQSAVAPPMAAAPAEVRQTAIGPVLADARGMTLYTFDKDTPGKSDCYGKCAINWPPLMAGPAAQPAAQWSIVARTDGTRMWAYRGKPLYTWIKDKAPSDTTGDNVGKVWHVARP